MAQEIVLVSIRQIRRYSDPILAWEYDQRNYFDQTEFDWFLKYARPSGGPVLELACGSGRIAIPLARCGLYVDGVDNAEAMLIRLNQQLAKEDNETRLRVKAIYSDIVLFEPKRIYGAVIIAYNSLQYAGTIPRVQALLQTTWGALAPGGRLLIVIRNRDLSAFRTGYRKVVDWLNQPIVNQQNGIAVGSKTVEYYDRIRDSMVVEHTYHIEEKGKAVRIIEETTVSPALEIEGLLSLLESASFTIKVLGGYDERSFSPTSKLACLICKRT